MNLNYEKLGYALLTLVLLISVNVRIPLWVSILISCIAILFLGFVKYKQGKLKSFAAILIGYALILGIMAFFQLKNFY